MPDAPTTVELLTGQAHDAALVERLTALVNVVYREAERGLWLPGTERTTVDELAACIRAGEIAVATTGGVLAGQVRVKALSADTGEFGMLAADPARRGVGVGRALVAFAEALSVERGHRAMRLELLVPSEGTHPSKVTLDAWYRRMGYAVVDIVEVRDTNPRLAPLLAVPCAMRIYERPLDR